MYRCGEGNGNPLQYSCLENPRMGEPGGLPSMGSHRVGHDWSDLAAAWTDVSCYCSATQLYPTLCDPMNSSIPGFSVLHYLPDLPKLMSIELVMPSNHLILCYPLHLLPSIFLSIRVFSNESVLRRGWPKYWSFSFSTSPSNEYSGLICFRIDWFDLAVQGTLKSLLQHHGLKTLQPNSLVCTWLLEKP